MIFTFKPLQKENVVLLYAWSKQPILLKFWSFPTTRETFNEKYYGKIDDPTQHAFMVYQGEEPFGYIQSYTVSKTDPLYAQLGLPGIVHGIDQFIGNPAYWGKGLGPAFITKFVEKTFEENPTIDTLIVDPLNSNERAIKCYEKVGFFAHKIIEGNEGTASFMALHRPQ